MACNFFERGGFFGDSVCGVTKKKIPNYTANNVCDTWSNYYDCEDYKKGSSSCFITSSVCFGIGMDDNCDELMTLRSFRDNWLKNQEYGNADIDEYYDCAPNICKSINKTDCVKEIYEEIYETYIMPCMCLIKESRFEQCYIMYKEMVNTLKERFT
jgi:hypothetical protein